MVKDLTMREFQDMCMRMKSPVFIFDTSKQPDLADSNLRIRAKYYKAIFMTQPNRLCLENESGKLYLDRIESICYRSSPKTGKVFEIACRDYNSRKGMPVFYITCEQKNR